MSRWIPALLVSLLSSTALAANPGLALETGGIAFRNQTDMSPVFNQDGLGTNGATAFIDLDDRLRVQLGYRYASAASRVEYPSQQEEMAIRLFLSEHRVVPGVRLDSGGERASLFAELNGIVGTAALWADDDPSRRTNPGQLKERTFVLGVQPMGGLEVVLPFGPPAEERAVGAFYKMGWSFETDPTWDTAGTFGHGGLAVRGGISLRL